MLKSFDDLIIEFDIPYRVRRKYNSLVDNIVQRGLLDDFVRGFDTFDIFSNNLILVPKVPRYSYSILSIGSSVAHWKSSRLQCSRSWVQFPAGPGDFVGPILF